MFFDGLTFVHKVSDPNSFSVFCALRIWQEMKEGQLPEDQGCDVVQLCMFFSTKTGDRQSLTSTSRDAGGQHEAGGKWEIHIQISTISRHREGEVMLCFMRQGPRGGMNVSNVSAMLGDQMEAGGKVNGKIAFYGFVEV